MAGMGLQGLTPLQINFGAKVDRFCNEKYKRDTLRFKQKNVKGPIASTKKEVKRPLRLNQKKGNGIFVSVKEANSGPFALRPNRKVNDKYK